MHKSHHFDTKKFHDRGQVDYYDGKFGLFSLKLCHIWPSATKSGWQH